MKFRIYSIQAQNINTPIHSIDVHLVPLDRDAKKLLYDYRFEWNQDLYTSNAAVPRMKNALNITELSETDLERVICGFDYKNYFTRMAIKYGIYNESGFGSAWLSDGKYILETKMGRTTIIKNENAFN